MSCSAELAAAAATIGKIQEALYPGGAPINSFEPFHPPMRAVRADGSLYVSEIRYDSKFPNSYLDITYPSEDTRIKRPTVIYLHGGGYFGGDKAMGDPLAVDNDATRLFREITAIGVDAYRGEAYAYSSTMLGPENKQFGQACVSQVTGTAAWMDVAATQYLLGVRPTAKGLVIDPAIPGDWKGYSVKRVYRGCTLDIRVSNPEGVQHGVKQITVDGNRIKDKVITAEMLGGKTSVVVEVVLG